MQVNVAKVALTGVKLIASLIAHHATWDTAAPIVLADTPPPTSVSLPTSRSPHGAAAQPIKLATTSDTIEELRRRLGKELYRMELDLQGGGRINGKPCDCLSSKHNFGIEATAEELMSYEANPLYGQVIAWYRQHLPEFQPEEIVNHPESYYQGLIPQVREFRKEVMGTEKLTALVSTQERAEVVARASEILKQRMETDGNL